MLLLFCCCCIGGWWLGTPSGCSGVVPTSELRNDPWQVLGKINKGMLGMKPWLVGARQNTLPAVLSFDSSAILFTKKSQSMHVWFRL